MNSPLTVRSEPIPGYRLIDRLGRGGFGEVWRCEAPGGIHKAIKFVYGDLEGAAEDGKPAEQELKALERIRAVRHTYILSIERYEVVEGQLMIVTELADRNLWDRYRECRTQNLIGIPREELLGYLDEAAEALDFMNQAHNLQHLDVKPQNLFLIHNHLKVADFGLVKVFEGMSASVTGGVTPVYAAPETFEGRLSRFCDQYSLAIVYQELLTGQRPFNGTTTRQLLLQHIQGVPDLSPLVASEQAAVGRALSKKPDERFPTCTAFVRALRLDPATTPPPAGALDRAAVREDVSTTSSGPARQAAPPPRLLAKASELISRRDPSVTQRIGKAPVTMQRPDLAPDMLFDNVPTAPPEQTGDGCLMPAVVLGVGHLGGMVLRRLRRATAELGSPGAPAVPHLRLLAIDTDPAAPRDLTADGAAALKPDEVYLARLQRPSHYLAKGRETGAQVESWLTPNLLYRLPRQPQTTGLRGLGRLALWDHYAALEQRVRAALQAALDPAALTEADRQTGLGLRTNRPRVYIVAAPAGGTGGGMFLDLAYLARNVLKQLGYFQPEVVGVLLLPPTERGASPAAALANTYAALTELNHYGRPDTKYELKISARQPPVLDAAPPFTRCLCLPLPPGMDAAAQNQSTGLAAALLTRELLTPLGRAADEARQGDKERRGHGEDAVSLSPCLPVSLSVHTASAYGLSWPRRRLARRAGLHLAGSLVRQWTAKEIEPVRAAVQTWLDEQWEARLLRPEQVIERVHDACQAILGQTPDAKFDGLVAPLTERITLGSPPDAWSVCKVLDEIIALVGRPEGADKAGPPGPVAQALADAARALGGEYEHKVAELAVYFIEMPQYRLAAAEEAIRQLTARLRQVLETYEGLHAALRREAAESFARLMQLTGTLEGLSGGGRRTTVVGEVLELLRNYAKKRYQALVAEFVLTIYRSMLSSSPEYLREVNFCRERLNAVLAALDATMAADSGRGLSVGPGRELFPGGGATLDEAAGRLVQSLPPEELLELDNRVQQHVRRQFRALVSYCLESQGQAGPLAELVGEQAEAFLAARLGDATAAAVFFEHFADDAQAGQRMLARAYDEAEPELTVPASASAFDVLAVPAGPDGEQLVAAVREAVPGIEMQAADSRDEVVFYREVCGLSLTDLPQLGAPARDAYQQTLDGDRPPHARFDVPWQLPPARGSNPK